MLKILQAKLPQYTNQELSAIKLDLEKGEEPEIKLPRIIGSWRKQGNFKKTSFSASLTRLKPLTVCITTNWKILKEMGIADHLTCSWKTDMQVKKQYLEPEMGWLFKIGKVVRQGCILSPCLFNLYEDCIMWNARLAESQSGIKIARININNLRYADDTTLMTESKEELKSLLMRVREESEKAGLKLNNQKTKIMASGHITSWQIQREKVEAVTDFIFWGSKISE